MFRGCFFRVPLGVAFLFRVQPLGDELSRFHGSLACLSQTYLREGAQSHIYPLFRHGLDIVEVPQLRAIDSHSHLKAVAISQRVVLFLRLGSFDFEV
ncbi:hypothetical protein D3C80_1720950 [compost metagenome]